MQPFGSGCPFTQYLSDPPPPPPGELTKNKTHVTIVNLSLQHVTRPRLSRCHMIRQLWYCGVDQGAIKHVWQLSVLLPNTITLNRKGEGYQVTRCCRNVTIVPGVHVRAISVYFFYDTEIKWENVLLWGGGGLFPWRRGFKKGPQTQVKLFH